MSRFTEVRAAVTLTLLVAALAAGCGGSPSREAVIRDWTKAVRNGDFDAAADLFALPAKTFNGGPVITLKTRADVDAFNRSFPCGAKVTGTQPQGDGYLLTTFTLVAARGGRSCAGSVGARARVSVLVKDGKIVEWSRVSTEPPAGSVQA